MLIKGMLGRKSGNPAPPKAVGAAGPLNRQALPPRMTSVVDMVSQHMLAIDGVSRVTLDTVRMGPPDTVRVAARGWSPSLHAVSLRISAQVDLSKGADHVAGQILEQIAPALEVQRGRSMAAALLTGRVEPLDTGHAVDLEHVHVDLSLDGLCRTAGYTLRDHLPAVVRRIHEPVSEHDGGSIHGTNVGFVAEHAADRGASGATVREAGLMIPYDATEDHPSFIYDGLTLSIDTMCIPETVVAMLPGRPLRDLVALHPALDGRVIRQVEQRSTDVHRLAVRFERDLVPFRTIAA